MMLMPYARPSQNLSRHHMHLPSVYTVKLPHSSKQAHRLDRKEPREAPVLKKPEKPVLKNQVKKSTMQITKLWTTIRSK